MKRWGPRSNCRTIKVAHGPSRRTKNLATPQQGTLFSFMAKIL
ncbi:hypothetical protein O59_001077 [Cellvibrio sp. BR]|nr:hypothetical protein O59_001077 [Cellvibrio sp. BR]